MEAQIEQIAHIISSYGWPLAAFVASPYISWRLTQWIKLASKSTYGKKPHWILMDVISWVMVFGMSYWFWRQHTHDSCLTVSFIAACAHTGMIKVIFAYAPKKLAAALQHGVYVDDKTHLLGRTVLGYGGKCTRSEFRKMAEDTELSGDRTEPNHEHNG